MLCQQKALDPAVYETYYWGSEAEYFSPWVDIASRSEEIQTPCLGLYEALGEITEQSNFCHFCGARQVTPAAAGQRANRAR